jgi:hypothetical protein
MDVNQAVYGLSLKGLMSGTVSLASLAHYLDVTDGGVSGTIATTNSGYNTLEANIDGAVSGSITIGGRLDSLNVDGPVSGSIAVGGTLAGGFIDGGRCRARSPSAPTWVLSALRTRSRSMAL